MTDYETPILDVGSTWLRWDPHVHAPGTVFNDQFKGEWDAYLTGLEQSNPPIRALGVTDYYLLDCYRMVRQAKSEGRLPDCQLIFPNVEMRLDLATGAGAWVNIHLLVNPERDNHLEELERFLKRLKLDAHGDSFCCSPEDLMKLGRAAEGTIADDRAALRAGAGQFKVSFNDLRSEYGKSDWAKQNILVAVAGSQGDGTSGVRDSADRTLREEVEAFAHVIFSSSPAQREFWLGRKALAPEKLIERYAGLKPCLHGSDGHSVERSGTPDAQRYSWIKGAPIFDSLHQAWIDPASRAFVGEAPPPGATPSEVISSVTIAGAPWLQTPAIPLNPGLVAIIGARGSGKTALAEMIAAGCDAHLDALPPQSFMMRAREHLDGARASISWQTGEVDERSLDPDTWDASDRYPRARYLSQQFVDELCSADGMTDALLGEVERVIFEAHPLSERDGAIDFADLREMRSERYRNARDREEDALATLSERISVEIEKTKLVDGYKGQVRDKEGVIARLGEDRNKLVAKGSEQRVARLEALTAAAEKVRSFVRHFKNREQQLLLMQDEVQSFRNSQAPEDLRTVRERHLSSGIKDPDWDNFLLRYSGDVDAVLKSGVADAQTHSRNWKGTTPATVDPAAPLVADGAVLEREPLARLEAEIARLQGQISIDRDTAQRFTAVSNRITSETELLGRIKEKLTDAEGADGRLIGLLAEREASYVRVFEAVLAEQQLLADLYAPIRARLEASVGTLGKLSFTICRHADLESWANRGEALLDLRKQGPFRGRGTLHDVASKMLKAAWESGCEQDVAAAMKRFRDEHQADLLTHAPVPRTEQAEYRVWSRKLAQWLYGTDHITVRYSVDYDGTDIRKLSPGTRGIVLLLLYLGLDDQDERPLIIDQPEENLDPKSIYDELVGLFIQAKSKRQVIMVTHNANLVINTDADQIIVAHAGTHPVGQLPPISYRSGGLEDPDIRKAVCDILEGGEHAFRERARRLRVRLKR